MTRINQCEDFFALDDIYLIGLDDITELLTVRTSGGVEFEPVLNQIGRLTQVYDTLIELIHVR